MQNNETSLPLKNAHLHSENQLIADWLSGWNIVNIRGDSQDPLFLDAVEKATSMTLPVQACSTTLASKKGIIWAGPDDWFWISSEQSAQEMHDALRKNCRNLHVAITDVSGGFEILRLSGKSVTEVLAQGCPLDLHSSQFKVGQSAGSVFFKASVWLWKLDSAPTYELLVRTSFKKYVDLLLETLCAEYPLVRLVADS